MNKRNRVTIFVVLIAMAVIIFVIFAVRGSFQSSPTNYSESYNDSIQILNDTIKGLQQDIRKYEQEIDRLDLANEETKKQLKIIIRENEKVDNDISNGDWEYNIKFLTDYLSEKDTLGE